MKNKNIWKYGFNWGSIIGGAFFVYHIIGFFLKIDTSFIWGLLGTFIIVFGMGWSMVNYKKNILKENLKFGKFFALGTIMSLVISIFFLFFMVLYVAKLNTTYLDNFLLQYQDVLDSAGSEVDIVNDPLFMKTIRIFFFPSIYIFDFIGNLFYVLLFSFLLSRPTIGMQKVQNRPNPNDYVPYQEVKEEDKEDEEDENKRTNEDERENDDIEEIGAIESSKGKIQEDDKEEKE